MSTMAIMRFGICHAIGNFVLLSWSTATVKHQRSLRKEACGLYEDSVSQGLRDTASATRDLAERLLGRQIAPQMTCSESDES